MITRKTPEQIDAIGPIDVVTKRILDDLEGNRRPG